MSSPRLDMLLYSHDGRGIGHASRTVAIGMAIRRLYPDTRVLFVSGTPLTNELRHPARLDWLKLPSYETVVIEGKSRGTDGNSNFSDREIGEFRAATLKHYVELYSPRVILADHSPMGKHKELLPALEASEKTDTKWVLGVRGVVGKVKQISSAKAAARFRTHYSDLLWYGDSSILSSQIHTQLAKMYGMEAFETGYVSRLTEIQKLNNKTSRKKRKFAATISIPWLGEGTQRLIKLIAEVIPSFKGDYGQWNIFLPKSDKTACSPLLEQFNAIPHCQAKPFGPEYHDSLSKSKTAIIYGGYNSLTDILCTRTPTLVLERGMQDEEQQEHLRLLKGRMGNYIVSQPEETVSASRLRSMLLNLLQHTDTRQFPRINLEGAENAAHRLNATLHSSEVTGS